MRVETDAARAGLSPDWRDDALWHEKLRADSIAAQRADDPIRHCTAILTRRARACGAESLALTGSTARDARTAISDIDYYLIGPRPDVADLPDDVDVYATSRSRFLEKVEAGDDYAHWTLRFGWILFDSGAFREGLIRLTERRLWPSAEKKSVQARQLLSRANAVLATGDVDAAREALREALSLVARRLLFEEGVFPLARAELPHQLEAHGRSLLGRRLAQLIYETPPPSSLQTSLKLAKEFLDLSGR